MKINKQKFMIYILVLAVSAFASGCASTGKEKKTTSDLKTPMISAITIGDNQLEVIGDKPFTYTIYKASDPYKLIVELPSVSLGMASDKITSDKPGIAEVVPVQVKEPLSTKIEILLTSPLQFESIYNDAKLTITLKGEKETLAIQEVIDPGKDEKTESQTTDTKEDTVAKPEQKMVLTKELLPATSIDSISIEKEDKFLKMTIKGNGSLSPVVSRLDKRAVIDIPNVEIKAYVPTLIPEPLKNIRIGKHSGKVRLVVDLKEETAVDVIAVEDSIIVTFLMNGKLPEQEKKTAKKEKAAESETKIAAVAPEKAPEGKYKGQKISLDFQDADIVPIFRLMADISGYNFVIDPSVKGKITMKLMNVPWDQALDIILQTFGLGKSAEGNIIWIAPQTIFTKIAKEKAEAKSEGEKAEELVQEVFRINYANADTLVNDVIKKANLLSPRGSIIVDKRMNTLVVKDIVANIITIRDLIKVVDLPKPQVMIEAKIVQVSNNYTETLGVKWGGTFLGSGINTFPQSLSGSFSMATPVPSMGSSAGSSASPAGGIRFDMGSASTISVNLALSALETINKSKTLSNPKILTLDNESAEIKQGRTFFVSTTSSEGTKTEEKSATLSLKVTPRIAPNEFVSLEIKATDDTLESVNPPVVNTKSVETKALVKNGETLVIGGIYTNDLTEGEEGIPFLRKIPLLGWLFKSQSQTGPNVKELLIFITPIIVNSPSPS
jgi:type IV pilus secretin PilQ/predicted competence protein